LLDPGSVVEIRTISLRGGGYKLTITLNRPEKLNAFTAQMMLDLIVLSIGRCRTMRLGRHRHRQRESLLRRRRPLLRRRDVLSLRRTLTAHTAPAQQWESTVKSNWAHEPYEIRRVGWHCASTIV